VRVSSSPDSRHGVTLVELAVAVAVFSILALAVLSFTHVMVLGTAVTTSRSTTSTAAGHALHLITEELREAQVIFDEEPLGDIDGDAEVEVFTATGIQALALSVDLDNGGDRVLSYRLPVDFDADGDVVAETGDIEWGVELPHPQGPFHSVALDANQLDGDDDQDGATDANAFTVTLRFVAVERWEYDERATGIDLNGDHQLDDVFEVGHLEKVIRGGPTATGQVPDLVVTLTPDVVLQRKGADVSDIDEDGIPDPLFELVSPTRLRIKLFCNQRWSGAYTLIQQETSVLLRNERASTQ
jgi:prepilin-type N-terminal cleavage/methylation domain-containing protein